MQDNVWAIENFLCSCTAQNAIRVAVSSGFVAVEIERAGDRRIGGGLEPDGGMTHILTEPSGEMRT
jgi:hypothetical protein